MTTNEKKEFNATREGQMQLCKNANSVATVLILNQAVEKKGGVGYPEKWIMEANPVLLAAMLEDLRKTWNELINKIN